MSNHTIYTRVYSTSSVGSFISAKGSEGAPLSDTALVEEFRNHANKSSREPSALVSGSDRIVDTLKRAFDKYDDNESPSDIWIAFIEVPPSGHESTVRFHSAKDFAEKCGLPKPTLFIHEVVFEWAIPRKYVLHEVCLKTLIDRKLQPHWFSQQSTAEIRYHMAKEFQQYGPWESGVTLGYFARRFGVRAPLDWISHQFFHDCVHGKIVDDDTVKLDYAHGNNEIVDFQFLGDLKNGIDTSLYDWWLSDFDSLLEYEEYEEWRDMMEESMTWDLIELWETWYNVDCDGTMKKLSTKERLIYDEVRNIMLAEHEKKRAAIEVEVVKIGL